MTIPVPRVAAMPFFPLHEPPTTGPQGQPLRRLNLNESPMPPSPGVIAAMAEAAGGAHRYPDGEAMALMQALSAKTGQPLDHLFVAAGSNELLAASAEIALDPGDGMVAPVPGFPTYAKLARQRGAVFTGVPVMAEGRLDIPAMLAAVTPQTRLMFVSSPHNPTGAVMTAAEIEALVSGLPAHVLLHFDEAYYEFGRAAGGPDALPLLARREGPWIATRTFSKAYGLAGARVGYGIAATPVLAQAIRKVRPNFSLNIMALAGAVTALSEEAELHALLDRAATEQAYLASGLTELGFTPLTGAANFVAALKPEGAGDLQGALRERGIHVSGFDLGGCAALRITLGTRADHDAVLLALREVLTANV